MRLHVAGALAVAAAVFATGCGSGDENDSTPGTAATAFDNADIAEHIGAEYEDPEKTYEQPIVTLEDGTECRVQILNTPAAVSTFSDAGDTVATNPDATAGVVVGGSEAGTCLEALTDLLSDFPPG